MNKVESHSQENNIDLKVIFSLVIFLLSLYFGFRPYYSNHKRFEKHFQSFLNCFNCGCFIGISLLVIIPEIFLNYKILKKPVIYPMFITFLSFCLILMIEKIIFSSLIPVFKKSTNTNTELVDEKIKIVENNEKYVFSTRNQFKYALRENNEIENVEMDENEISYIRFKIKENKWNDRGTYTGFGKKLLEKKSYLESIRNYTDNFYDKENKKEFRFTPYVLILSIASHGFFEGIELGVDRKLKSNFLIFLVILSNKIIESYSIGFILVKTMTASSNYVRLMIFFSLFTPLGIIFGMFFSSSSLVTRSLLSAISSGAFLYSGSSETMIDEFVKRNDLRLKYASYVFGGIFIGLIVKVFF